VCVQETWATTSSFAQGTVELTGVTARQVREAAVGGAVRQALAAAAGYTALPAHRSAILARVTTPRLSGVRLQAAAGRRASLQVRVYVPGTAGEPAAAADAKARAAAASITAAAASGALSAEIVRLVRSTGGNVTASVAGTVTTGRGDGTLPTKPSPGPEPPAGGAGGAVAALFVIALLVVGVVALHREGYVNLGPTFSRVAGPYGSGCCRKGGRAGAKSASVGEKVELRKIQPADAEDGDAAAADPPVLVPHRASVVAAVSGSSATRLRPSAATGGLVGSQPNVVVNPLH